MIRLSRGRHIYAILLPLLASAQIAAAAQATQKDPVPLKHWSAPQYLKVQHLEDAAVATAPLTFIAVTPCRLADTRPGSGYPALGSSPLPALTAQTLSIAGACGAPSSPVALAYSLNISVVPPAGNHGGYLTAYPNPASPAPTAASLTWNPGAAYSTNAVAVESSSDGSVNIIVNSSTDVVVDINGYYTAQPTRTSSLVFNANSMSAFPPSGAATTLAQTVGSAQPGVFPITAWSLNSSTSVNLMLTFNVPLNFAAGTSAPVIHVHFITGPGSSSGTVNLPLFFCSAPPVVSFPASCFVTYPKAVLTSNAAGGQNIFTFNHYDLTYTINYSVAGRGIAPGDLAAVTIGRGTDSFGDVIYVTSAEFNYPTN